MSRVRLPRVWIYMMDPRTTRDLVELAHETNLTWAANPFTSAGDIVLMYRRTPFSDIAYAFTAVSAPRATLKSDGTDAKYVIDLSGKVALTAPITLKQMKWSPQFGNWAFASNQQGVMGRKRDLTAEGIWPTLLEFIRRGNPGFVKALNNSRRKLNLDTALTTQTRTREILRVFVSYAREDVELARKVYNRLRREGFVDPWFDLRHLPAGAKWEQRINQAIKQAEAAVIVITSNTHRPGFIQHEIELLTTRFSPNARVAALLPAKYESCRELPILAAYQHVDLHQSGGYDKLMAQLAQRAEWMSRRRTRSRVR